MPVTASVSGVTLTNGSGVGGNNPNGGALHVALNATLTLTDSAVTDSDSQNGNGGGIYTDGNLTLNRVTVSGNEATGAAAPTNGGGIYHNSNNNPPRLLTITNSTISGNTTNGSGGGIYSAAGSLDLQSTTIAENTAGTPRSGSGLFKAGSGTVIEDSIIAATSGAACAGRGVAHDHRQQQPRADATCSVAAVGEPAPRGARRQRRSDRHARPAGRRARRSEPPARLRTAAPEPISAESLARRAEPATSARTSSVVLLRSPAVARSRRPATSCRRPWRART